MSERFRARLWLLFPVLRNFEEVGLFLSRVNQKSPKGRGAGSTYCCGMKEAE